jgi:hypothetical protein
MRATRSWLSLPSCHFRTHHHRDRRILILRRIIVIPSIPKRVFLDPRRESYFACAIGSQVQVKVRTATMATKQKNENLKTFASGRKHKRDTNTVRFIIISTTLPPCNGGRHGLGADTDAKPPLTHALTPPKSCRFDSHSVVLKRRQVMQRICQSLS